MFGSGQLWRDPRPKRLEALVGSRLRSEHHETEVDLKVLGAITITAVAALASFVVPVATGSSDVRAAKPRVLCLNYAAGNFYVRSRPARCDYYSARAPDGPIVGMAIAPTRSVRWTHWGVRSAVWQIPREWARFHTGTVPTSSTKERLWPQDVHGHSHPDEGPWGRLAALGATLADSVLPLSSI